MTVVSRPSPNHGPRRDGSSVDMILLHYTAMESAEASLERLCDPLAEVSAHYLIDTDGTLYNLVDEDRRAWHAGLSFWAGESDINSRSIGIELQNKGPGLEQDPFPQPQLEALIALCLDLQDRHAIPPYRVLGHSDVSIGRKHDPGPEFPWRNLASAGVGIWPQDETREPSSNPETSEALRQIGYDTQHLEAAVAAFRLHWVPEVERDAALDSLTVRRAQSVAALVPLPSGRDRFSG